AKPGTCEFQRPIPAGSVCGRNGVAAWQYTTPVLSRGAHVRRASRAWTCGHGRRVRCGLIDVVLFGIVWRCERFCGLIYGYGRLLVPYFWDEQMFRLLMNLLVRRG